MIEGIAHLGLLDDDEIELVPAGLELAALDRPGVDLEPSLDLLDEIAAQLEAMSAGLTGSAARANALCELLAGDYGFEGDRLDYGDPANADMIAVLERRRGLPVSLSMLYADVARHAGWECEVLNVPGHVLIRLGPEDDGLLLDPYNGGAAIDGAGVGRLLSGLAGRPVMPQAGHFAVMSNREVLARLLQNLASRAEARGDKARAIELYARMTVVAPGHGPGWWHHARLSVVAGSLAAARQSLGSMLELTRDPELRRHIVSMLENLAH